MTCSSSNRLMSAKFPGIFTVGSNSPKSSRFQRSQRKKVVDKANLVFARPIRAAVSTILRGTHLSFVIRNGNAGEPKDTHHGPEVWEVKHGVFWRKCQQTKLPTRQHTPLVCRNVLTGEIKYFLSNQVIGREGATLGWLLQVAFGRWEIEQCFGTAKEELGRDQFEVRGWATIGGSVNRSKKRCNASKLVQVHPPILTDSNCSRPALRLRLDDCPVHRQMHLRQIRRADAPC